MEIINQPDWAKDATTTTTTTANRTKRKPKTKKPVEDPITVETEPPIENVELKITNKLNRPIDIILSDSSTLRLKPNQTKHIDKKFISPDLRDLAKRKIIAIN